jgi:hypothetical protein
MTGTVNVKALDNAAVKKTRLEPGRIYEVSRETADQLVSKKLVEITKEEPTPSKLSTASPLLGSEKKKGKNLTD